MFIEPIKDPGLAHVSYVIGDGREAAVIDPRRDCDIYLRKAAEHGAAVTHIFDTHRNEDFVHGSPRLAERTGAPIHHGAALDFDYGRAARGGDVFDVGDLRLTVLETPGHTDESISIAAAIGSAGSDAFAVFTGDALFAGDVGRADFYPDRAAEVAGELYDSLFDKILPLGDGVLLYPAHVAGSVCGSGMADRNFSTLGFERKHNPMLALSRAAFVEAKLNERHYQPPYFRQMESVNLAGPPAPTDRQPRVYSAQEFAAEIGDGLLALDVREPEAFCSLHVPGALLIPQDMLPSFAGWFLPYERPIGLIAETRGQYDRAVRHLARLGYDRVQGYLHGGMTSWESAGRPCDSIPSVTASELKRRRDDGETFTLLDVRSVDEHDAVHVPGAVHRYVGLLAQDSDEQALPAGRPLVTFCSVGRRAAIAAAYLKRAGIDAVENCFGSMQAWQRHGYEVERAA